MPVLNLRDVPEELMRELRAQAALRGAKFHPFCIDLLKSALDAQTKTLPRDNGAVFGGEVRMLDYIGRGILAPMPSAPADTAEPAPPENLELEIT
jgi:hypothetical protein